MQFFTSIQTRCACMIVAFLALVSACTPYTPAKKPTDISQCRVEALDNKFLQVNRDRSLVTIKVHRGGRLARLGHNHIVASRDVSGYVAIAEGRAELCVPLDRLTVDETELRAEAGLDTTPTQDVIEGTRRNMLVKVLESALFPFALIRIARKDNAPSMLNVSITLHGSTRTFEIPAQIETDHRGMIVSGRMTFKQSDFGIVPFSVLGGALQVQDKLDLNFRIVAGKV